MNAIIVGSNYGIVGNGVADDSGAIQSAINDLEAQIDDATQLVGNQNTIFLPRGNYGIRTPLRISKGIRFIGDGMGDVSTDATNPSEAATRLIALKTDMPCMIEIKADIPDEWIYFPEIRGIYLRGNSRAHRGLIVSSTKHATVEIAGDRVRDVFLQIDDGNNRLNGYTNIPFCFYQSGMNAYCENSIGVAFVALNLPSLTRAKGGLFELVGGKNGAGLFIGDIDSSYFEFVSAGVHAGGTGNGIVFGSSTVQCPGGGISDQRTRYSRKNYIAHVNGKVLAKTGTKNWIGFINSEPSEVVIEPGASLHYSAIDSNNGMRYQTARLKMSDNFRFSANDFEPVIGSPVKRFAAGGTFNSWKFEKALDSGISTTLRLSEDISQGRIPSVEILFIQRDHGLGNINFETTIRTCKLAEPIAGGQHVDTLIHGVNDEVNQLQSAVINLSNSELIDDETKIVDLIVARRAVPGPNGSVDNFESDIFIISVSMLFHSDGPKSIGGKTWSVPDRKIADIEVTC